MFVTDKLVFLQLRKTGCGHIARLLSEYVGGRQVGVHNRLTADLGDRFVVGSVRNPWEWYVSVWAFAFGGAKTGVVHSRVTQPPKSFRWLASRGRRLLTRGRPSLEETRRELIASYSRPYMDWRSTYTHPEDAESFRKWLRLVLDPRRSKDLGEGYGYSSIHRIAGFYTFRYLWLYSSTEEAVLDRARFETLAELQAFDASDNVIDFVIRTERLEEDLVDAIEQAGHQLTPVQKDAIRGGGRKKTNSSHHRSVEWYYDRETADLVAQKEKFLIAKYGYSFPGSQQEDGRAVCAGARR